MADLKSTLYLLEKEFRTVHDHLKQHIAVISGALDQLLADQLAPEDVESVLKALPSIIPALISSDRSSSPSPRGSRDGVRVMNNRQLFVEVNRMFSKIVALVLRRLPETPEIISLLCEIFRYERFYDMSRVRDMEPEQFEESKGEFSSIEGDERNYVSVFYARHINAFGDAHGFDMLGNFLASSTNITVIKSSFRLIFHIYKRLKKKMLSSLVKLYIDAAFKRLLDLKNEQLKSVSRDDIGDIVNNLDPVIRSLDWESGDRITEEFCLQFSIKSFQSEMIEKRRSGLEYIDDVIAANLNRFNNEDDYSSMQWSMMGQRTRTPKWLTKSWMLGWLLDNRILDGVFDARFTKEPLIKKCRHILAFIAMEDKLKIEVIDGIWACSMDKYLQDATYEAIVSTARHWRPSGIKHVWAKINALPRSSYSIEFVEFLFKFTKECQYSSRLKEIVDPNDVLSLYWHSMQDDSGAPLEVTRLSLDKAIATITEFGGLAARKLDLYPIFFMNIKKDKSATQVIRCLDQIIDGFHNNKLSAAEIAQAQFTGRTEVVHALDKHFDLINVIVQELVRYKRSVAPALVNELKLDGGQTALYKVLHPVGKLFTHQKCLEYRLDFLFRCLHRLGPVNSFKEEAADTIFSQIFHSDDPEIPVFHSEKEMCLNFIRIVIFHALDGNGQPGITQDVARHIFENWFCSQKNDYASMNQSDFFCFKAFFTYINLDKIKILQADQGHQRLVFASRGIDLYGVNELWLVLTQTDHDGVFDDVANTLIMIFTKFTTRLREPIDNISKQFLVTVITLLQKSTQRLQLDPLSERDARNVNRFVKMLRRFLVTTQKPMELVADDRGTTLQVEDPYTAMPAPSTPAEVSAVRQVVEFTGASDLVATIALQSIRWSVEHAVDVLFSDRRQVIDREAEKYEKASKSKPKTEATQQVFTSPKELLVNDQRHFETLLELLKLPLIDRNVVWEIIESLPANKNIEFSLRTLSDTKFSELLDLNSPFKMLYSLRIIDSLMLPRGPENSPEKQEEAKKWCRAFFYSGGFNYVYKLVQAMGHSPSSQSSAQKSCLVLLLKIVHHFMKGSLKDLALTPQKVKIESEVGVNPLALSQGSSQSLVQQMDFGGFVTVLINILWNIVKDSDTNASNLSTSYGNPRAENLELVNHAMYLLASIISSRPTLLQDLYSSKIVDFKEFLIMSVMKLRSRELRQAFTSGWQQLCAEVANVMEDSVSPSEKILGILIAEVPFGRESTFDVDDYFDLLSNLFAAHFDKAASLLDIKDFSKKLIVDIHSRPGDTSESESHTDHILGGALKLLAVVMKHRSDIKSEVAPSLLADLFQMTVVRPDGPFVVKCLSARSRGASFELMKELARDSPDVHDMALKLVSPITKWIQDAKKDSGISRREGYVGFSNPRHISCYANSLMQQFYMIPEFKNAMFSYSSPVESAGGSAGASKPTSPLGNAVREIQRMFGFLQLSERHHIDPTPLIQLFDKKMNLNQQNDASEFFSHLAERIETDLADTANKTLVDDLFKISLNREIICGTNNTHISEGLDESLLLGVEIFKTNNLGQALKNMFEGDKLEYKCETCKANVEARRVWSIKSLPPHLVVHIKRFAMDFNTMLLEKVTSLFEYPFELDLSVPSSPFTFPAHQNGTRCLILFPQPKMGKIEEFKSVKSTLTHEECIYDLVGVLVHSGTKLEAGHYYSFIKDRGTGYWQRFDDTSVTEFDPDHLAAETFGGEHTWLPREERESWQNKNAYMLFYEQRHRPVASSVDNIGDVKVPEPLANVIVADNTQLVRERVTGDKLTVDFVKYILESLSFKPVTTLDVLDESSPVFVAIDTMTSFLLDGKIDRSTVANYESWVTALTRHYQNHVPACRYFLATLMTMRARAFTQLVLDAPELHVRQIFTKLVQAALTTLYKAEESKIPSVIDASDRRDANGKLLSPTLLSPPPEHLQPLISSVASIAFVDFLLSMMEDTRPRWQRFHQYWNLMHAVVNLGQPMRRFLAARKYLFWLVDYYMGPFSLRWKQIFPTQDRVRLGIQGEMHLLHLHEFFEVVTAMAVATHTRGTERLEKLALEAGETSFRMPATSRFGELVTRDLAGEEILLRIDVLSSLIKQAYSVDSNINLCQHISWDDEERSCTVMSVLLTTVKKGSSDRLPVIFPVIEALIATEDSLKYWRPVVTLSTVGLGLFAVAKELLSSQRYPDKAEMAEALLVFAFNLAGKNEIAAAAIRRKHEEIRGPVLAIFSQLIKEVQEDVERNEHTDDQMKLARLTEVMMRWRAFLDGESDLKEAPFPADFDLSKFNSKHLVHLEDD